MLLSWLAMLALYCKSPTLRMNPPTMEGSILFSIVTWSLPVTSFTLASTLASKSPVSGTAVVTWAILTPLASLYSSM